MEIRRPNIYNGIPRLSDLMADPEKYVVVRSGKLEENKEYDYMPFEEYVAGYTLLMQQIVPLYVYSHTSAIHEPNTHLYLGALHKSLHDNILRDFNGIQYAHAYTVQNVLTYIATTKGCHYTFANTLEFHTALMQGKKLVSPTLGEDKVFSYNNTYSMANPFKMNGQDITRYFDPTKYYFKEIN